MRLFGFPRAVEWPFTIASRSGMMDKMWLNRAATLKVMLWDLYYGKGTISRRRHLIFLLLQSQYLKMPGFQCDNKVVA